MAKLTIYKDNHKDYTEVSNLFIDKYMKDANDAQLKVYLYLIRMLNSNLATSVSDIADKFNHTEKDVMRSLRYWEKQGVLTLEFDSAKNLVGICLNDLSREQDEDTRPQLARPIVLSAENIAPFHPEIQVRLPESEAPGVAVPSYAEEAPVFVKPTYTAEQLREFKKHDNVSELLFVAQSYFGRTLSPTEMKSIFFMMDKLHFSDDLIDHLLQYCVDRGKKDFKYIEKVAINWAQQGISTWEEAQESIGRYDKNTYVIMNELGKNGSPTKKEMEYINRWTKEYGFCMEVILEACQRTVISVDTHRFEYAEGILQRWKKDGVMTLQDIARLDEQHQRNKKSTQKSNNKFNQFTQNDYDFDDLEKKLISN
ncbi:MAG: DnaD domain protein [Lachnospiraceae bacterium]|nr:DnaD domain protein [Lachnospiraceae bacterium]